MSDHVRDRFLSTSLTTVQALQDALTRANQHWNAGQVVPAEQLCQQVLAAWPGQPDALHLLGLMAHGLGNLDLAIQHVRAACQAPRAPALYFSNLAEMCRQRGLLAEAEAAGRRAVSMNNTLPGAWNNLGIILQERGNFSESRTCLERSLTLQPDHVEVLNNLGNTCLRLGLGAEAERHWLRALALRPGYAQPHSNLAFLLNARGEHDRAAEHAQEAIDIEPRLADAYVNLAAAETGRGRHAQALHWLDGLLAFAPAHGIGLASRAMALQALGQPEAALDAARRAVEAAPHSDEARNMLGLCLRDAGRIEPALAAFAEARALGGAAAPRAALHHATLLAEAGRLAEARQGLAAALAAHPRDAVLWHASLELQPATEAAAEQVEVLLAEAEAPQDRLLLHFALGKALLDLGEDDRGFHHLGAGNALKRATLRYDAEAMAARLQAAREVPEVAGEADPLPVFILGLPRAGMALVEQVLAAHPSLHGAGALPHVAALAARPEALGAEYLARVRPLAEGRRHVLDRVPLLHAGLLHRALPAARFIHVVRDARDLAFSCHARLFAEDRPFAYQPGELGAYLGEAAALAAHWRATLPAAQWLEVRYEDVVRDLAGEARRMLEFLGLPWHAGCLEFPRRRGRVSGTGAWRLRTPLDAGRIGLGQRYAGHLAALGL